MNTKQPHDWLDERQSPHPAPHNGKKDGRKRSIRQRLSRRYRREGRAAHGRRSRFRGCFLRLLVLALAALVVSLLVTVVLMVPPSTNVLILGLDRRPGEGDAVRADTILLLHTDSLKRRAVLLSIPRDLWVTIPGWGDGRINSAHLYGELDDPGNGLDWMAKTIKHNFDVPVHRSLRLDFDAFRALIDAVGGIEIDVPTAVIDDAYPTQDYGTMRIEIPAGLQHMDGALALQYARSRHASSDFDRADRQQQILVALATKLSRPSGWRYIPSVHRAFNNAVDTDLSLLDFVRLFWAWQRAGDTGLEQIVIDQTLTTPFLTSQGSDVLLPRWDLIQLVIGEQFTP